MCGTKNQKMVLTNIVLDAILYLKMNYQHMLQKFPYPNARDDGIKMKNQTGIQKSDGAYFRGGAYF